MSTPIEDPVAVREAYEDVRSDSTETTWCLLKYEDNMIKLDSKGNDVEEVCGIFNYFDNERAYAYLRFETGDEMSRRAKFAFLCWIGMNVGALNKAKCSTDKASVKTIFSEFGVELLEDEASEVQHDKILQKLEKASGASYGTGV